MRGREGKIKSERERKNETEQVVSERETKRQTARESSESNIYIYIY